jgi:hypothetical protein
MGREYAMSIGSDGGIGDAIWQFSILPNLKMVRPDCFIRLYLQKDYLYPIIEGLYDEIIPTEEIGLPLMFFMHSPQWGKIDWRQGGHLMDLFPGMLKLHFDIIFDHYFKMPYSRFFVDHFKPSDYYICFGTRTSVKLANHGRSLPIETFYKVIAGMPDYQFVQLGEVWDDKIDLPNVIDKRCVPFTEVASIMANAGMLYGLQSGLRVMAESLGLPFVCYHNLKHSTYDLPLTKHYTRCIYGNTQEITDPSETIDAIKDMVQASTPYFEGCKNVIRCKTKSDVDAVPECSTVVVDWQDIPLEIYAKTVAINKRIRVMLEK